jgi:hypothetical protein
VVLLREVLSQQTDGGQGQGARSQELEDQRKAPAGPSRVYAVAGGILGEPKGVGAKAEERAVALSEEECRAAIEFGQVGHQLDRGLALLAGEGFQAGEEGLIRQCGGDDEDVVVHMSCVSRRISGVGRGPGRLQERRPKVSSARARTKSREATGRGEEAAKQAFLKRARCGESSHTSDNGSRSCGY